MTNYGLEKIAEAITPPAMPAPDAAGGLVTSLTEAVMGITAGLMEVAAAVDRLAEAAKHNDQEKPV